MKSITYNKMALVCIDVGGVIFRFNREALKKYPDTLLGEMFTKVHVPIASVYMKGSELRYFFGRNPAIFKLVAQYYTSGAHNMGSPVECTISMVREELEFWRIPAVACSSPEDKAIADILTPALSKWKSGEPIIVSSRWLDPAHWKDDKVPEQLLLEKYDVDAEKTKELIDRIEKQIYPGSLLRSAIERNGVAINMCGEQCPCGMSMYFLTCNESYKVSMVYTPINCQHCKFGCNEDGKFVKDKCKATEIQRKSFRMLRLR